MTTIEDELRPFDREAGPMRPEHPLIAARRVRGTAVFGRGGERLGRVCDIALDKRSGRAAYVVLAYGGVLGMGRRFHAVPWQFLSYDPQQRGFATPCSRHDLERDQGFRSEGLRSWTPPVPKMRDASLYPTTPRGVPARSRP